MKRFKLSQIFQLLVMALLLLASGLTLEGCTKKKKNNAAGGGPGYGYAQQGAAGCGVPNGVSQVLRSSFGYGSILTVYVIRHSANQIQLFADLVVPSDGYYGGFSGCLGPSQTITTYKNSSAFENFSSSVSFAGNGAQLGIYGGGTTYLDASALLGAIHVTIPQSGFNGNTLQLTATQ